MEEKIETIKYWLRTGSINIFGLPMSGKDTVGVRLAEVLGGKFLSSGMIIRAMEQETKQNLTNEGKLIETNTFYDWVLPYFERRDLEEFPLILSSVGRWSGEENQVLSVAESAGHPIKAVVLLNISEGDVISRWEAAQILNDRGNRLDDKESAVFKTRINEFIEKTIPVLKHYREMGLLVEVKADMDRESVFKETIEQLCQFAENSRTVV